MENLYLGGVEAVSDHSKLTSQGVRAICVCCREFEIPSKSFATGIDYYRVDVEDMSKEPLEEFLEEATDPDLSIWQRFFMFFFFCGKLGKLGGTTEASV